MMDQTFHCPRCQHTLRQMSRNMDFFCRGCYTSVVMIDEVWAETMGPEDSVSERVLIATCVRHRGTQPLSPVAKTSFLDPRTVIAS